MPGIDPTIALGIKVPDQTTQLSSLLNAASTAQTVQNNGISLNERQAVGQFLSNPSNYTDASGNVDGTRLMQGVMKVAPTTGAKHVQDMLTAQKQHTEALSALNTLDDQDRTRVANVLSTIPPGAPADVVNGTFDALGKQYRGRIDPTINLYKQGYAAASKAGPQAVGQFLQSATRGVLPQTTQQDMDTPSTAAIGNNRESALINIKPGVQGQPQGAIVPGSRVQQLLPLGQNQTLANDRNNNPYVVQRDNFGNITGTGAVPGAANSGAPSPGGPAALPPGETDDTLKQFTNMRTAANTAARTVPDQQFNNNQIIKLAKTASLGQDYGGIVKGFTGHFAGLPGATQGTVDYDKIEHFLALQQGTLANQAGFNSDASRAIADKQAGSTHGTAEGVTSIARTNRALALGADLYNRGNEKAIGAAGNNVFAQRQFQQQWAHAVDYDALRLYDAIKNKQQDPEGVPAIVHELGGTDATRYKTALSKIGAMRALILGQ